MGDKKQIKSITMAIKQPYWVWEKATLLADRGWSEFVSRMRPTFV